MPTEECPNCNAYVPRRAKACPECGADAETGWNDRAAAQRLGVSEPEDDSFDYEEFTESEFGKPSQRPRNWFWAIVAMGLILVLLGWYWRF